MWERQLLWKSTRPVLKYSFKYQESVNHVQDTVQIVPLLTKKIQLCLLIRLYFHSNADILWSNPILHTKAFSLRNSDSFFFSWYVVVLSWKWEFKVFRVHQENIHGELNEVTKKKWLVLCFSSTWCYCGCFLSGPGCVTQSCDAGQWQDARLVPGRLTSPAHWGHCEQTEEPWCPSVCSEEVSWTDGLQRCEQGVKLAVCFQKAHFLNGFSFFLAEHFLRVTATWC